MKGIWEKGGKQLKGTKSFEKRKMDDNNTDI
jgi:hypothetical protein